MKSSDLQARSRRIFLLVGLVLGGCGAATEASRVQGDDASRPTVDLGHGYRFADASIVAEPCFDVSEARIPPRAPKASEGEYFVNIGYDRLMSSLSASGQITIGSDGTGIDARGSYAKLNHSTNFVSTLTYLLRFSDGVEELDLGKRIKLTPSGRRLIDEGVSEARRAEICGSHIVVAKKLHFALVATIRIEFSNAVKKQNFDASLKLGVDGMEVFGRALRDLGAFDEDVAITVDARQMGGDPFALGGIVSGPLATCDSAHRESCVAAMRNIVEYGQKVKAQFHNPDGSVDFSRLAVDDIKVLPAPLVVPDWAAERPSDEDISIVETARGRIKRLVDGAEIVVRRADALLKMRFIGEAQASAIQAVRDVAERRISRANEEVAVCYPKRLTETSAAACDARTAAMVEQLRLDPSYQVDYSDLVILPSSFKDYCELLKAWYKVVRAPRRSDPSFPEGDEGDEEFRKARERYLANLDLLRQSGELLMSAETRRTTQAILDLAEVRRGEAPVSLDRDPSPGTSFRSPDELQCGAFAERVYSLREANLKDQGLEDLSPLSTLTNVVHLDLSGKNHISDLTPVAKIVGLKSLILSDANVGPRAVETLGTLGDLRLLDLSYSLPRQVEGPSALFHLAGLKRLNYLILSNNEDLVSLDELRDLPNLLELDVRDSPVSLDKFVADLARPAAEGAKSRHLMDFRRLRRVYGSSLCGHTATAPERSQVQVQFSCDMSRSYGEIIRGYVESSNQE
jgi:hypothetical protein